MKSGCRMCKNLRDQMNRQGVRWCRMNREYIIGQMADNAAKSHSLIPESVARLVTDTTAFRAEANRLLGQAIGSSGRRSSRGIHHSRRRSKLANSPTIPTDPIPFTGTPRLSLMFHVWPHGDGWKRHTEKLAPVLHRFDRKLLGIAVDSSTATATEVAEAFGQGWEITEAVNNPAKRKGLREVETYQQMLPILTDGVNDVTFCAHAKGVQTHTAASEPVTWWTDAMYESILYNIDGVLDAMRDGASVVGSFRRHGKQLGTKYRWHFSGTYYAFRNIVAFSNGVPDYKQKWWGTESWPGDHFPLSASHCIFGDGINDLYKTGQQPRVELREWKEQRANSTR